LPTLRLSEELATRIRAHAANAYPYECCGALLGRERNGSREVLDAVALPNQRADSRHNRFAIAAGDVRAAEQAARAQGLELLGWYHSHPDHAARPSEYDREHAWPWYSYLILSVASGEPNAITAWRLADDRSQFLAEGLETVRVVASEPVASRGNHGKV